jgi:hypothetical protein
MAVVFIARRGGNHQVDRLHSVSADVYRPHDTKAPPPGYKDEAGIAYALLRLEQAIYCLTL